MNAKEFVSCWSKEKNQIIENCFNKTFETSIKQKIASLNLNKQQEIVLKNIFDELLTDTFYTLLLGLDGCSSIGGVQSEYKIYDEQNHLISDCGELEAEAYEQFLGDKTNYQESIN